MKYINYIIVLIALTGCANEDRFVIPKGNGLGSYDYVSSSVYFDEAGDETRTGTNYGVADYFYSTELTVTPLLGWEYELALSNLQVYTLSTGQQVTTFSIALQEESIYSDYETNSFRIKGTKAIEFRDPNGVYYGDFDGLIDADGVIKCEFESVNIETYQKVRTTIEATPSN